MPVEQSSMPTPAVAPTPEPPAAAPTPAAKAPAAPSPAATPIAPAAPSSSTTPLVPTLTTPEKPAVPPLGIPGTAQPLTPDSGIIPPLPGHSSLESTPSDSGILTVWVPYEAKVTINGLPTKSTGSKRHFVSYGMHPGYTYKYEVKAEVVREGKIVTEVQTISLVAGEQGGIAFGFNNPPEVAQSP
jgi:uncharacterized protein (TIGR03000 family)